MNTYTPNAGLTPAATQLTAGQPSAANSTPPPPGSPSSAYGSDAQLNASYADANANNVTANAPATRQTLVNNSNVPAEQSNYDDLAKKLFDYDQGTLAPQFAGTNAGIPTDAASFGRVDASPLAMTVGSAGAPSSVGLAADRNNPKYAYSSQIAQGNAITSLLGVLNNAIKESMTDVKGKNASNVSNAQAALDGIYKLMGLKQNALDHEAANAKANGTGSVPDAENHLAADAKKGTTFTDLAVRYGGTLPLYRIRELYNQANYYGKPATESDQDIINAVGAGKGTTKGKTTVSAKPVTMTTQTTTTKGQKTVSNWQLKLSDGSTRVVQPDPGNPGILGFGAVPSKTSNEDAQQIYNDWKSSGHDQTKLIQALTNAGFTIK